MASSSSNNEEVTDTACVTTQIKTSIRNRNNEMVIFEKLNNISGPTWDLKPLDYVEKKFSYHTKLFVGNIPPNIREHEIIYLFESYGDIGEIYLSEEKNFAFVKMDYRLNARKAKCALNGYLLKDKFLNVRFAKNESTLKVKNLDDYVTNELLHLAFSIFGELDRCVAIVDDDGRPTGEGIIEFLRKPSAMLALQKCTDSCFFLTSSLRPVIAEIHETFNEFDGYSERNITRKTSEYFESRSVGPRFALPGSLEYQSGMQWKQLYAAHHQQEMALQRAFEISNIKLKAKQKREQQAEDARRREVLKVARENEMKRIELENNLYEQACQLEQMMSFEEQTYNNFMQNENHHFEDK